MSFDRETRNKLARMVADARRRLVADATDSLRRLGLQDDGTLVPFSALGGLSDVERGASEALRELLGHFAAQEPDASHAVRARNAHGRLVREIGFTTLNRLVALRMAEERGLIVESVRNGFAAGGFQLFERIANGSLGSRAQTYRAYLECLYDELGVDLPSLFTRAGPESQIFPDEATLESLLELLNDPAMAEIWKQDETIGWVYQYYNDRVERRQMREALAPQNGRELAVRNQFFTPRYVVEFLTDNTLGRMWYEMRRGDTCLRDECRYLVPRRIEVFLQPGELPPGVSENGSDLSQAQWSKQPEYVAFRSKRDPRDLKILDPACGSGHFLLYAFDLLETIYQEAWRDDSSPRSEVAGGRLSEDYSSLEELRAAMPGLILRYNLHGVDIDPRAVQIAGLALWLRAQATYQRLGVPPADRPRLTKANLVVAEPMPGEADLLDQFVSRLDPPLIGGLVKLVFNKMQIAGEAGTLLKIQEELRDAITAAKVAWQRGPKPHQLAFLPEHVRQGPEQMILELDTSGISDGSFWERLEQRVFAALREFAAEATDRDTTLRRLFADDAERGFAFIDLCRQTYDVILMNPPFGVPSLSARWYTDGAYQTSKEDVDAAFVTRALEFVESGFVGALINRTQFFKPSLRQWRLDGLLSVGAIEAAADFGYGVLDGAVVEAAAYVLRKPRASHEYATFLRLLRTSEKADVLLDLLSSPVEAIDGAGDRFDVSLDAFSVIPESRIAYWASDTTRRVFGLVPPLEGTWGSARQGLSSADDFRFLRLAWETPSLQDAPPGTLRWVPLAKGGEYEPYFQDLHLVIDWAKDGAALRAYEGSVVRNPSLYFRPAITYTERTASGFSPRVLPPGCIFTHPGPAIVPIEKASILPLVGVLMSRPVAAMIELMVEAGDAVRSGSAARHYTQNVVGSIRIPPLVTNARALLTEIVEALWRAKRDQDSESETSRYFLLPAIAKAASNGSGMTTIREAVECATRETEARQLTILGGSWQIEQIVRPLYGYEGEATRELDRELGVHPEGLSDEPVKDRREFRRLYDLDIEQLIKLQVQSSGGSRAVTKKTYFADRRLELLAAGFGVRPARIVSTRRDLELLRHDDLIQGASDLLSYSVGLAFGRWAYLTDSPPNESDLPGPLSALPHRPPAMQRSHSSAVLIDDADHDDDLVLRVRGALAQIWTGGSEGVESEICELLESETLGDYFRRPTAFFSDHLKRYSKSRRQAPIYWPMSTASGSYTVWLYYQRLTSDTLFTAINRYIQPKIADIERQLREARGAHASASAREATRLLTRIEELTTFLRELNGFRDELLRITQLPYRPNLNDGVIINAAPLHKLFRLPKWAKDTREVWQKLERGDYDWAHMAYSIWPDRVREKCRSDRSLAIAHDLEHLYSGAPPSAGKRRTRAATVAIDEDDE